MNVPGSARAAYIQSRWLDAYESPDARLEPLLDAVVALDGASESSSVAALTERAVELLGRPLRRGGGGDEEARVRPITADDGEPSSEPSSPR